MKRSPMSDREKPLGRNTPLKRGPFDPKRSPFGSKKSPAQRQRDKARKAREFARIYGSLERVFFVQMVLRCRITGARADNAHIEREGMGRKADYTKIIPLSRPYHTGMLGLDTIGRERFEQLHPKLGSLDEVARQTEKLWQERGAAVIAQAKADGTYDAWLNEGRTHV